MTSHPHKSVHGRCGFTVAELLIAMAVSGIVLAAVATLAFATGKADTALDDLLTAQKFIQFDTRRLADALRYSRAVFQTPSGNIALWRADDNSNNRINGSELLFVRMAGSDLRLCEFAFSYPADKAVKSLTLATLGEASNDDAILLDISIAEIKNDAAYDAMSSLATINSNVAKRTLMKLPDRYNLDVCTDAGVKLAFSNMSFGFPTPWQGTGFVNLGYDLTVKRVDQKGQVTGGTRTRYNLPAVLFCSADNVIENDEIIQDDD
jgi:prepilin-type N-terminal cleavage/methylation domain-containing protein